MHLLPLNKNASGCGDVFIAKLKDPEWDEHGWTAYEDVSSELLDSGLYRRVLERLAENLEASFLIFFGKPCCCGVAITCMNYPPSSAHTSVHMSHSNWTLSIRNVIVYSATATCSSEKVSRQRSTT